MKTCFTMPPFNAGHSWRMGRKNLSKKFIFTLNLIIFMGEKIKKERKKKREREAKIEKYNL